MLINSLWTTFSNSVLDLCGRLGQGPHRCVLCIGRTRSRTKAKKVVFVCHWQFQMLLLLGTSEVDLEFSNYYTLRHIPQSESHRGIIHALCCSGSQEVACTICIIVINQAML